MAKPSLLSLFLTLVFILHGCLADRNQWQQRNECQIDQLSAREPTNRVEYEGGVVETWEANNQDFQCAGVAAIRYTINQNGLLLPSFTSSPTLMYIVQGEGLTGVLIPGCPETYQSSQGSQQAGQLDQHQKIRHFGTGDVLVFPAGVAHWCHNEGNTPVVAVGLIDVSNSENQLDQNPRKFHLAGNPRAEFQWQQQQQQGQQQSRPGGGQQCNHLFCGFDTRILAEAFNVDENLIRRLQNENDNRGAIVRVRGQLQVIRPPRVQIGQSEESQGQFGGAQNGMEETLCTMKLRENIGHPSRADIYSQQTGHISTLNSLNLPVLGYVRLNAEKGLLHNNAILVPHWNPNAHSIMYVIRGSAHVQVVDNSGRSVFNGEVRQGQILTVPQNFAVVKRARSQPFEWISFKTNDQVTTSHLTGRTSVIRGMPAEVLANAFQISTQDALRLKFSNQQTTFARGTQSTFEQRDVE